MTQTPLNGRAALAPPFSRGFDADTVITGELAGEFVSEGYQFCARYLSLGNGQQPGDLSTDEAAAILGNGLALVAVQHVNAYGWKPSAALGFTHGGNAAANAKSIGLASGMNIWCDLEGVATGISADDVIAYCVSWYDGVIASNFNYIPGLYVGPLAVLDGQQLYDLPFQHYWKSASNVPEIPTRGFQMVQGLTITVCGISIDPDTTQTDAEGGTVIWMVAG